jgi:hypothetical protein
VRFIHDGDGQAGDILLRHEPGDQLPVLLDDSGYLLRGWLGVSRGAGQSSHRSSHRQTQN